MKATFTGNQAVNQSWSSTYTQSGTVATFKSVSWNAALAPSASAGFGFLANVTGTNSPPTLTCSSP